MYLFKKEDYGGRFKSKQASRIINIGLYGEYTSLIDLIQKFACVHLTRLFAHWSVLHGAGFSI